MLAIPNAVSDHYQLCPHKLPFFPAPRPRPRYSPCSGTGLLCRRSPAVQCGTGLRRRNSCGADQLVLLCRHSCGAAAQRLYCGERPHCSRTYTAPTRATAGPTQLQGVTVPIALQRRRGCGAAALYGGERPPCRPRHLEPLTTTCCNSCMGLRPRAARALLLGGPTGGRRCPNSAPAPRLLL